MNSGVDTISEVKATLIDLAIRFGPTVVTAILILIAGAFLIMALQNLGVELLPLIAGLGVAGAGIALAWVKFFRISATSAKPKYRLRFRSAEGTERDP